MRVRLHSSLPHQGRTRLWRRVVQRGWRSAPLMVATIAAILGLIALARQQSTAPPPISIEPAEHPTTSQPLLIDLNLASQTELETLPGIGRKRAADMVAARRRQPFGSLTDLVERNLIRPDELAPIAERATVYVDQSP